ncbi:NADH dehydrogenase [ubiquinone] 1 beta subcomplex subunit NP15.6 [Leptinotarsa decemlineata]|uniref:NADH dehydrogenase [ubiquinone] 1 beta subcomplex subunit NP15.6 n=1 Tax=Leptinotarsa decemlineata TaxID=7539 RepID=UPI000C253238|nr:NADH dehydrogenase [ubiquinone] 1 beta subcomplex subunit 11, mitochondrial [Leptinotarsa decemlineata]
MAGLIVVQQSLFRKILPAVSRRLVSTSKKSHDTVSVEVSKAQVKTPVSKNWVSYGYNFESKEADRNAMHSIMFASVTLCLVVGGFFWAYMPDYNLRDWAQREAFLELRRREENNLPLVDPNLIDPAKIVLPTDEELGDTEIII